MKRGEIINGYLILEDFKVAGGRSKISFAEKEGKEYFIKEYLYPKYPSEGSPGSERIKEQKKKACEAFESHQKMINDLIGENVLRGGNLILTLDFFREGSTYYKVNEKIEYEPISLKDISNLPLSKILIVALSVCHSISILHKKKIVHGDLKPENILIKETSKGNYSGKLIDFDDSYLSGLPPIDKDQIVGTPEYYSPELAEYIMDEEHELSGDILTLKSDIFTLGIILTEYFTNQKPQFKESVTVWKGIKDSLRPHFSKSLSPMLKDLLLSMLSLEPAKRPSIMEVLQILRDIRDGKYMNKEEGLKIKRRITLKGCLLPIGSSGKDGLEKMETEDSKSKLRGKGLDILR